MQIHNLVQGSPEWHQFRLEHFGASEAAAMLGLSPKVKRTELLHMKHTGNAKEFSDWVQRNILDYGHEVEVLARPLIEETIGEELYPVTCSKGRLSASCDGLTMLENVAFEHKQWNESLAESVRNGIVPDEHLPQCQQIALITSAEKVIFTVSDGTPDRMVYTEVLPCQDWFDRIKAGWAQFEKDLVDYVPVQHAEKPAADTNMQLPALAIQIRGEVVTSNLPAFRDAATEFIANIKTELETDEDFANAEATVKFCEAAEKNLELTKSAALGQTASIDELMKTIDFIQSELRAKRLMLNKMVTTKKAFIKDEILIEARDTYMGHITALELEIKPTKLDIQPRPDFAGAAKNKRTLASLHDAVDTELANAKITADAVAKDIRAKLAWCKENADGYGFLFKDMQLIIDKPEDDFQLIVNTRITEHKQAEEAKLEIERERIREEEKASLAASAAITQASAAKPVVMATPPSTPATAAVSLPEVKADSVPDLRLGQISERLSFEPAGRERSAVLFQESDFDNICVALIDHIDNVRVQQKEAA